MPTQNAVSEFTENATCGFTAGFITGAGVSAFELIKVKMQSDRELTLRSMATSKFVRANWKAFAHTAPTLGLLFGGACAIEFSTNAAIGNKYGTFAGLTASAFNCAVFLTPADYLMLRKDKGFSYLQSLRHFWGSHFPTLFTGFVPMVGREYLFGLSVLLTGPLLGEYIKQQRGSSDDRLLDAWWCFVGTLASGIVTTTASQPFDCIAREMQKIAHANNSAIFPRFRDAAFSLGLKELYRGYTPRLVLASVGGASAGALFKFFKEPQAQVAVVQQKIQP